MSQDDRPAWSVRDSLEHYRIEEWGRGYFTVNDDGHVAVLPGLDSVHSADLHEIVDKWKKVLPEDDLPRDVRETLDHPKPGLDAPPSTHARSSARQRGWYQMGEVQAISWIVSG